MVVTKVSLGPASASGDQILLALVGLGRGFCVEAVRLGDRFRLERTSIEGLSRGPLLLMDVVCPFWHQFFSWKGSVWTNQEGPVPARWLDFDEEQLR